MTESNQRSRTQPRLHTRVIVTESGACVEVMHVFHGSSKAAVQRRTRCELRRIIRDVARDHPKAEPLPDEMDSALEHGCWWAELGSETFSVLVLTPETPDTPEATNTTNTPEAVEFLDLPIEIDIRNGRVTEVRAPQGLSVLVRDYDTDGVESDRLTRDADGKPCVETRWNEADA